MELAVFKLSEREHDVATLSHLYVVAGFHSCSSGIDLGIHGLEILFHSR